MRVPDSSNTNLARSAALLFFLALVAADFLVAFYLMRETFYPPSKPLDQHYYFPIVNKYFEPPATEYPTLNPSQTPTVQVTVIPQQKYVVQAGDTLFQIATQYGVSLEDLVAANQIADPDRIAVGQELLIPGYQVPATPAP